MPQRYQSGVIAISGVTVVVHGLTAGTPTEYGASLAGISNVYFAGVSSTNMVVASAVATGNANANVFASIPHSIIQ